MAHKIRDEEAALYMQIKTAVFLNIMMGKKCEFPDVLARDF